ncbi:MAG: primosomal protein N' [bacterium]
MNHAFEKKKSTILLLPEVSLSLQFEYLFKRDMPSLIVYGFHSASKASEKKALWQNLLKGTPMLIIGVHLPMLLPIQNLGLIIIDEEHETGFQEKKHPKINSKHVALWRAQIYKLPILLGSATPSLTSLHNIEKKRWLFFQLKNRFVGTFPSLKKILLTDQRHKRRPFFWVSAELEQEIHNCLARKEQAIVYLNRRGYSFFVQCKTCGFIFECPNCSVSLTLHRQQTDTTLLRCHYCDYRKQLPNTCPTCKTSSKEFLKKGIGTQQVVHIFQKLFPHARIERADLDTTRKKRSWQQTAQLFEQGAIDILIGTKSITKGYHFPNVTLIGILWGDLSLSLPHFNASETTLQELIQVAGRAGRSLKPSKVIVQLIQDHPLFDFVCEEKYLSFTKTELEARQATLYPPFCTLLCLELCHKSATQVQQDATELAQFLKTNSLGVMVLGPADPIVHKIQKIEIQHIFLKSTSWNNLYQLIQTLTLPSGGYGLPIKNRPLKSSLFFVYC